MREFATIVLLLGGASFTLLASVGVLRLPDLFIRMHAATKSGTLGVTGIVLALAVYFWEFATVIRAVLIVIFVYLTAPVAAHVIARAAYMVGVPLWERSVADELADKYDPDTQQLRSYETGSLEQNE